MLTREAQPFRRIRLQHCFSTQHSAFSIVMNGVLVIDKPAGPTSHDVVAVVRRAIGSPQVGHTGTLDPLATGVLPLVIGRATRLASFMSGADKEYVARIRFGSRRRPTTPRAATSGAAPSAEAAGCRRRARRASGSRSAPAVRGPLPANAAAVLGQEGRRHASLQARAAGQAGRHQAGRGQRRELELASYADGLAEVRLVSLERLLRALAGARPGPAAGLRGASRGPASNPGRRVHARRRGPARRGGRRGRAGRRRTRLVPMDRLSPTCRRSSPTISVPSARAMAVPCGPRTSPWPATALQPRSQASGDRRLRLLDRAGSLLGLAEPRDDGLLHPVVVLV